MQKPAEEKPLCQGKFESNLIPDTDPTGFHLTLLPINPPISIK